MPAAERPYPARTGDPARRALWLRTLHQWHWISSALCLVGMLVFAATGITLNHAATITATPTVVNRQAELPATLLGRIDADAGARGQLPDAVAAWLEDELRVRVRVGGREAEFDAGEAYLALPRPGGDAWLSIDLDSGAVEYERTDRGWVAYFNDLHKGRGTGAAWSWFIDVFAIACLIFCLTGLFLLYLHGRQRPATWPVVGLGLLVPLLLVLLFIH